MPDFVHLHNHSDYSLMDSAASIPSLVHQARNLGMKHLALTDHGNMFGALSFHKTCREAGINPIIGCEFYLGLAGNERSRIPKGVIIFHRKSFWKLQNSMLDMVRITRISAITSSNNSMIRRRVAADNPTSNQPAAESLVSD
jgi:DNA polymerase III alpha subunit